jgi:hypothetical protein
MPAGAVRRSAFEALLPFDRAGKLAGVARFDPGCVKTLKALWFI